MKKQDKTLYVIGGFVIPIVAIILSFTGILGWGSAFLRLREEDDLAPRVLSAARRAHAAWTRTSKSGYTAVARNPLLPAGFLTIPSVFDQQFSLNKGDSTHG